MLAATVVMTASAPAALAFLVLAIAASVVASPLIVMPTVVIVVLMLRLSTGRSALLASASGCGRAWSAVGIVLNDLFRTYADRCFGGL